jgi:hypothetical protein
MWEIHMLGLTRRELETDPRGTAPVLDPTDEAGTGNGPMWHRASSRPYLGERRGEIPLRHLTELMALKRL